jgi:hypothetical protein
LLTASKENIYSSKVFGDVLYKMVSDTGEDHSKSNLSTDVVSFPLDRLYFLNL